MQTNQIPQCGYKALARSLTTEATEPPSWRPTLPLKTNEIWIQLIELWAEVSRSPGGFVGKLAWAHLKHANST